MCQDLLAEFDKNLFFTIFSLNPVLKIYFESRRASHFIKVSDIRDSTQGLLCNNACGLHIFLSVCHLHFFFSQLAAQMCTVNTVLF